MSRHRIASFIVLVALILGVAITFSSCMGPDPEEAKLDWLLKQGRGCLEIGEGSKAYNYFKEALEIAPDNREALYGFVLALDLRVFAFVDGIIDLLFGVFVYEPSLAECEEACARLEECYLFDEAWTTKEDCLRDCPFNLQPEMFDTLFDGSSCAEVREEGLEWIIPLSPEDCVDLCDDLDFCGLIHPPVTFSVEECYAFCPYSYVERHSMCYLEHLGECNGFDRTCFEHVTVGLQILFREIGIYIPPQIEVYTEKLFKTPDDYQYYLKTYRWNLYEPPLDLIFDGRFSQGFLYLSRGLGNLFQGFLLFAGSVNLEMNFPSFDVNLNYMNPTGTKEIVETIVRNIKILLYDPIFPLGFQIIDEPWAYAQVEEGAQEIGKGIGAMGDMFEYVLNDHDRQPGKAIGYEDDNRNFNWDKDEKMFIEDAGGLTLSFSRDQAIALKELCAGLEANLVDREPFELELIIGYLHTFDSNSLFFQMDVLIDLLKAWYPEGKVDISYIFYEPNQNNMRNWLKILIEKLEIILLYL